MIYTINKVDYPCSGSYNNVEASVVYNDTRKEYYILITPQKLITDCWLVRYTEKRTKSYLVL